jgi:hypothetical protein
VIKKKPKASRRTTAPIRVRLDEAVANVYIRASLLCKLPVDDVIGVVLAVHIAAQKEMGKS